MPLYQIKYRLIGYDYHGPHEIEFKSIDFDKLEQQALNDNISLKEAVGRLFLSENDAKEYTVEILNLIKLN